MNATAKKKSSSPRNMIALVATLVVAVAGGLVAFKVFYKKDPPPEVVKAPEPTNVVAQVKVETDLFPGRRNAHGIFYVPVRDAQATALALAAAQTNETNEATAQP
jgi:flagellar basal body-associated protein FliL